MLTRPTLGISGLDPAAGSLTHGAVYLVASEAPPLARALLFGNLPKGSDRPLLCVSSADPALLPDTACLDERLRDRSAALLTPLPRKRGRAEPLERQLVELAHYRARLQPVGGPMLLVLDEAETHLPLEHGSTAQRSLAQCRRWAAETGHTLLLVFSAQRLDLPQLALLSQLGIECAGLAFGQQSWQGHYTWQVEHWQGDGALTIPTPFPLTLDNDGRLQVDTTPDGVNASPRAASDRQRVLATRSSLPESAAPSQNWQLFDTRAELLEAAETAVAATVLFDAADSADLPETISRLRQRCGKQLKILLREIGNSRLRHSDEQLLLNLGANAILPAELSLTSVLSLVGSLQQAVYQGRLGGETDTLEAASRPESDRGYLPPARFAKAVSATVERSRLIGIQNVLLILHPAPGASPLDMLRLCRFKRAGDLCTADREHVYLFLFACRDADVDTALRHLFRLPVSELFADEVRSPDLDSIRLALEQFREQEGFSSLPDLSEAIAKQQAATTVQRAAPQDKPRTAAPIPAPLVRRTPMPQEA
ncbi:cellulose biosynthesis protein BcsE [Crenobacter sp. SG2305]|uniref:cellulose biosynthesis protein BcsE n=1 Tax=Crenobacter oryzisoli TaxID=3056844 RepID=UPI0025AB35F0|nr:cellulose biosynthesis protein BcsE [Crenobacter sp. SG2305]MDN0084374.1 cellulose biosynthesis protein BcsE [Crenobacter sp. SG2305]